MSRNDNGEGSVWQRKDGRWSGAVVGRCLRLHTGRTERRYVYNVYAHVSLDVQRRALDALNAEIDQMGPEE